MYTNGRDKFTDIYMVHKKWMLAVAYDIVKDRELAEDIVHKAFVKIIERLDNIDDDIGGKKTRAFCAILVRHEAINQYNYNHRHTTEPLENCMNQLVSKEVSGVERIIQESDYEALVEMVNSLPKRQSKVFWLRYSCNFSFDEIGAMLGMTAASARQNYTRARQRLMNELKDKGDLC